MSFSCVGVIAFADGRVRGACKFDETIGRLCNEPCRCHARERSGSASARTFGSQYERNVTAAEITSVRAFSIFTKVT